MEVPFAKTLARIGGALIIASLLLPWYKFDFGALGEAFKSSGATVTGGDFTASQTFSAWDSARTVFYVLGAFGILALTQVPFASPAIVGRVQMFAGFGASVLVAYKIFSPPLDFLSLLKMKLQPQPGIYLALVGTTLTAWGGWEQTKVSLAAPRRDQQPAPSGSDWHTSVAANPANQAYAQPQAVQQQQYAHAAVAGAPAQAQAQMQPGAYAPPQPPRAAPPPPQFTQQQQPPPAPQQATHQTAAPRAIPPDPFAPKQPPAG